VLPLLAARRLGADVPAAARPGKPGRGDAGRDGDGVESPHGDETGAAPIYPTPDLPS